MACAGMNTLICRPTSGIDSDSDDVKLRCHAVERSDESAPGRGGRSRRPFVAKGGCESSSSPMARAGYIALYSHEAKYDVVLILAIRHQREAGYTGVP
jgi:hypothetical protein